MCNANQLKFYIDKKEYEQMYVHFSLLLYVTKICAFHYWQDTVLLHLKNLAMIEDKF